MGWFGSSSNGSSYDYSSATVTQLEQQIEMMDMVFMKYPLGSGASILCNYNESS